MKRRKTPSAVSAVRGVFQPQKKREGAKMEKAKRIVKQLELATELLKVALPDDVTIACRFENASYKPNEAVVYISAHEGHEPIFGQSIDPKYPVLMALRCALNKLAEFEGIA